MSQVLALILAGTFPCVLEHMCNFRLTLNLNFRLTLLSWLVGDLRCSLFCATSFSLAVLILAHDSRDTPLLAVSGCRRFFYVGRLGTAVNLSCYIILYQLQFGGYQK